MVSHLGRISPVLGAILAAAASGAAGAGTDATIDQAAASWRYTPRVSPVSDSASNPLADWAGQASLLASLSGAGESWGAWAEIAGVVFDVMRNPHAGALFQISARPRDGGGHRLAGLDFAIVADLSLKNRAAVDRRLQNMLDRHADTSRSSLSAISLAGFRGRRFSDRRLPAWCTPYWVIRDDVTILGIGDPNEERFHALAKFAVEFKPSPIDESGVGLPKVHEEWRIVLHPRRLLAEFDPLLVDKTLRVLQALGLASADRIEWSIRREGRAVLVEQRLKTKGQEQRTQLGTASCLAENESGVPVGARSFTYLPCKPLIVARAIKSAYLASRSPESKVQSERFWSDVEKDAKTSLDSDVLGRLKPCILIHDFPIHALELPIARTVRIPVDHDGAHVKAHLNDFLLALSVRIQENSPVRLVHETDGVWFIRVGLAGPALLCDENWLWMSFSPQALREAVAHSPSPASTDSGSFREAPPGQP